jgi:WD40 repeat protein
VRLWHADSGDPVGRPFADHDGAVLGLAFSPDDRLLASAGADGALLLWQTKSGAIANRLQPASEYLEFAVTFSPDGQRLASAGTDGAVTMWEANSWKQDGPQLRDSATDYPWGVYSLAFGPHGHVLASAYEDAKIRLWDPMSAELARTPLSGHAGSVASVAFSPDGLLLASAGADGVWLWSALWDIGEACRLSSPYVVSSQLKPYLPTGWKTKGCDLLNSDGAQT